ncbi:MAG: transketolase family protein [Bacteroidetes bacterium]|nr:transketolase family protein [Bacteroidota bacterium]
MKKYTLRGNKPTRHGFGEALAELGEKNQDIVVLGADVTGSVMTSYFKEKFPERFFSIGIAEQNATTIAVGFALSGKIPFFASYAAFSTFRNADQLRISVCYNRANVKIAGGHAGVTVGPDGATHQVLEDLAIVRTLPNMTVVVPCDFEQAKKATVAIANINGPAYIRLSRSNVPLFTDENAKFEIGKIDVLQDGSDVALIACGTMVWQALLAAEELYNKYNIKATVVNNYSIKPLDKEGLVKVAKKCGAIVTAEEHQVIGGMGSAIAELLSKECPTPINFVGMQDKFGESGEPNELLDKYKLNAAGIVEAALEVMKMKK